MTLRPRLAVLALVLVSSAPLSASAGLVTVNFEGFGLPPNSFDNGRPPVVTPNVTYDGSFTTEGTTFNNTYTFFSGPFGDFESWSGWALSNLHDTATGGFGNQYSVYDLAAPTGSTNAFAMADGYSPNESYIALPDGATPVSIDLANATYAALSYINGDSFTGRPAGEGDYFRLLITGFSDFDPATGTGTAVAAPVDFYLADYQNGRRFVLETWATVDLSSMAGAKYLGLEFQTTLTNAFGIALPTYVAADNLVFSVPVAIPEPTTLGLVASGAIASLVVVRRRRR